MAHRIVFALLGLAIAPALAGAATNLVSNPRFDADISGWLVPLPEIVTSNWSPVDELDKPASGSLRFTSAQQYLTPSARSECFPVTGGARMVFGASSRSTGGFGNTQVTTNLEVFDNPGCGGTSSTTHFADRRTLTGSSTWGPMQGYTTLPATAQSARLHLRLVAHEHPPTETFFDNAFVYEGTTCVATPTVACLGQGRFRVDAEWQVPDGTAGHGSFDAFSDDSAHATFFDPANTELVVKVLDACELANRYWIFAAGLTNVDVTLRVEDTESGQSWLFHNPMGEPFPPVQDTNAFATCVP